MEGACPAGWAAGSSTDLQRGNVPVKWIMAPRTIHCSEPPDNCVAVGTGTGTRLLHPGPEHGVGRRPFGSPGPP
jgi:hypothetical protein